MLSKHPKLTLKSPRVQSFITCLKKEEQRLIKGRSVISFGHPTVMITCTDNTTGP